MNGIDESQRREIDHTFTSDEQSRRDQLLLQEQLPEQNRDLREAHVKSLHEMEELKRVQESRVDESSRRRWIKNQDTINEPTVRIQELQNEVNCMNDSRDFEDAESVRSGRSHVPSQPALLPPTQVISGNVFANPPASSSAPYPQELNPWSSQKSEQIHSSQAGKSENQTPVQDQRCQSGPSARNAFDPKKGRFSKDYGADQQRLQISDLHVDKFPTPTTFACWKLRFKTEVCTCSQFPTEAMLWIKELEMV